MTWHIVCHDCDFEKVRGERIPAKYLTIEHRDETGHNVEYANVEAAADGGEDQDEADDLPSLHIGDHVLDRDDEDGATLLVVGLPLQRAATYDVDEDGTTVADYNPDYPAEDHAIEVTYPQRSDVFVDELREYAFPRSRLELVAPVHDREEDDA